MPICRMLAILEYLYLQFYCPGCSGNTMLISNAVVHVEQKAMP